MRRLAAAGVIAALMLAWAVPAFSTPEKAKQTGKGCSQCHPNAGPHHKK